MSKMIFDKLAVIVKTTDGKHYQVALTQEMCDALFIDLKNYFTNDIVKVLPNEIKGIELVEENFPK